jgi:choline monooxygenase
MTNLANTSSFLNTTQLPVSWYADPAIYRLEQQTIFQQAPGYVGHELMVPAKGDFYALPWMQNAKALVHNDHGVELISNICRHRQAILLEGNGNTCDMGGSIVCPLHRWTYNLEGKLLGAPHFPSNPCLDLGKTPLQNWHGMLFNGPRDVARDLELLGVKDDLDFTGYQLDHVDVTEYDFNWKTFIEVYLEDYHVEPFHPGLGRFVTCEDLKWEFGDHYSVQTVGVNNALARPGSAIYQKWHDQVLAYNGGEPPRHGAIWLVYYPNIMIEWYPHTLVISTILPTGPQSCTNVVEFYYPEDIALFEPEFVAAEQAAYRETAREDEIICRKMQQGRAALFAQGINEAGPYQSPMEDGMVHFNEWVKRHLAAHLPPTAS